MQRTKSVYNERDDSLIWHFDISVLIRYTISDSLLEMQQFRHECSSIMYENTQKTQKN